MQIGGIQDSFGYRKQEENNFGDNILITSYVYVSENSPGSYKGDENDLAPDIPPEKRQYIVQHVKICSNVWMGEDVIAQM